MPRKKLDIYDHLIDSDIDGPLCKRCKRQRREVLNWPREQDPPMCFDCIRKVYAKNEKIVNAVSEVLGLPRSSSWTKYVSKIDDLRNEAAETRCMTREQERELTEKLETIKMVWMQNVNKINEPVF